MASFSDCQSEGIITNDTSDFSLAENQINQRSFENLPQSQIAGKNGRAGKKKATGEKRVYNGNNEYY